MADDEDTYNDTRVIIDPHILRPGNMQKYIMEVSRKYEEKGEYVDAKILMALYMACSRIAAIVHGLGDQMHFKSTEKLPRQRLDIDIDTPTRKKKFRDRQRYDGL